MRLRLLVVDPDAAVWNQCMPRLALSGGVLVDTAAAAVRLLREQSFDAVIAEQVLPDGTGFTFLCAAALVCAARLLVGTGLDQSRIDAAHAEGIAWLAKPISPAMLSRVLTSLGRSTPVPSTWEALTPHGAHLSFAEQRVAIALCRFRHDAAMADDLHLSPHTVHNHLSSIYRKLGVHSRLAVVARLVRFGLVDAADCR